MSSLVTGVAGFIGSHLAEKLIEMGETVIGIDSFTDFYPRKMKEANIDALQKNESFTLIEGDLLNVDLNALVEGVDYIFHEAAQAGVRYSWGTNFDWYVDNNIRATQRLLEASKGKNLKRLIYASSSSVYGDVEKQPITEDSVPRPVSPYGVTKLAGENLCRLYWKNYGVPTIILRYFTVYGPRQRPDMAIYKFIDSILSKKQITVYGAGDQSRDFTYVTDIVKANILAMRAKQLGQVFNIGGGSSITINRLLELLEEIVGIKVNVRFEKYQHGDVMHTLADTTLARKYLGYRPSVGIEEGIAKQIEWLRLSKR